MYQVGKGEVIPKSLFPNRPQICVLSRAKCLRTPSLADVVCKNKTADSSEPGNDGFSNWLDVHVVVVFGITESALGR